MYPLIDVICENSSDLLGDTHGPDLLIGLGDSWRSLNSIGLRLSLSHLNCGIHMFRCSFGIWCLRANFFRKGFDVFYNQTKGFIDAESFGLTPGVLEITHGNLNYIWADVSLKKWILMVNFDLKKFELCSTCSASKWRRSSFDLAFQSSNIIGILVHQWSQRSIFFEHTLVWLFN